MSSIDRAVQKLSDLKEMSHLAIDQWNEVHRSPEELHRLGRFEWDQSTAFLEL